MSENHICLSVTDDSRLKDILHQLAHSRTVRLSIAGSNQLRVSSPEIDAVIDGGLLKRETVRSFFASKKTVLFDDGKEVFRRFLIPADIHPERIFDTSIAARLLPPYPGGDSRRAQTPSELLPELKKMGLAKVAALEFRLLPVVAKMELDGCRIDVKKWREAAKSFLKEIRSVLTSIAKYAPSLGGTQLGLFGEGEALSASQLHNPEFIENLFRQNGVDLSGHSEEALRECPHPLAKLLLRFRHYDKLLSFSSSVIQYADHDGRIHPTFDQLGAETGRFTCKDPNIQQIPQELRNMVVASPGHLLVTADYSQVELRILAELSGDRGFADIFCRGGDLHSLTAAEMFNVPLEEVTPKLRNAAKAINFGLVYGRGPGSLGRQLGISASEATEMIERYFDRYRQIRQYLEDTSRLALMQGYTTTLLGRRRYFRIPGRSDPEYGSIVKQVERQARNSPIQGTSADMIKLALINVHNSIRKWYGRIVNTVHDEIVVEVPEEKGTLAADVVRKAMEEAGGELLKATPVKVDVSVGPCWGK